MSLSNEGKEANLVGHVFAPVAKKLNLTLFSINNKNSYSVPTTCVVPEYQIQRRATLKYGMNHL